MEAEKYGLEEVHRLLLIALDEFDNLCKANNIKYSLHGGTLLGARRNNKFIPWDDDADVSMTRENYNKLIEAIAKYDGELRLEQNLMWVPRLVIKEGSDVTCIDIFIWDYISEKKWQQFLKLNLLRATQGMLKKDVDYSKFGFFNKILLFVTYNCGKLFKYDLKLKLYHFLEEKCFQGKRVYIHRSNDAFKDIAYIFDSEYMSDYTEIEFEGRSYMVNRRYEEFLVRSYGEDYLIPPPPEKRVTGHENTLQILKDS